MNTGAFTVTIAIVLACAAAFVTFMVHRSDVSLSPEDRQQTRAQRGFQWILLTLMFPLLLVVVATVVAAGVIVCQAVL